MKWTKRLWEINSTLCVSEVKTNGKGLAGLPSHDEKLGYASSGVTLLEVLVYGDVNMIGVYFVKATKAVVLCRWLLA